MRLIIIFINSLLSVAVVCGQLFPVYFDPKSTPREVELESSLESGDFITKTVYGFLDFVTTIGDTVMVFKPGAGPTEEETLMMTKSSKTETMKEDVFAVTSTVGIEGLFNEDKSKPKDTKIQKQSSEDTTTTPTPVLSKETKKPKEKDNKPKKVFIESSQEHYDYLAKEPDLVIEEKDEPILPTKATTVKKEKKKPHVEVKSEVNAVVDSKVDPKIVNFPVGLVTKIGGTIVQEGLTTVHETKVIGTYIEGKYAQILQSTSHIFKDGVIETKPPSKPVVIEETKDIEMVKSVIEGTSTRMFSQLTSIAPKSVTEPAEGLPLEKLFAAEEGQKSIVTVNSSPDSLSTSVINAEPILKEKPSKSFASSSSLNKKKPNPALNRRNNAQEDFLSRLRSTNQNQREALFEEPDRIVRFESTHSANRQRSSPRFSTTRKTTTGRYQTTKSTPNSSKRSSSSSSSARKPPSSNFKNRFRVRYGGPTSPEPEELEEDLDIDTERFSSRGSPTRSSFRRKTEDPAQLFTVSPSFRSNMQRPSGRWRYKATEIPKVSIRTTATVPSDEYDDYDEEVLEKVSYEPVELEPSSEVTKTIRLTTSTAEDDPSKVYEIATIKSVYTFKVGSITNSRFITVTTTMEKSLSGDTDRVVLIQPTPTLHQDILLTKAPTEITEVDNDVAVLPPIGIAGEISEPPLKTITETFSTNQLMLKTSILPVVYNSNTTYYTLTQSYHVTKMVSALKTIPPSEAYQYFPTDNFNDLNAQLQEAGSEHREHLLYEDEDVPPNQKLLPYPEFELENEDLSAFGGQLTADSIESILSPSEVSPKRQKEIKPTPVVKKPDETVTNENQLEAQPAANALQQQQLALLGLYNPYLAANIGLNAAAGSQQTTVKPVYETKTLYETNVLPIFDGHKTFMTTLIREAGLTTITKEEVITVKPTQIAPQIPIAPAFPNIFNPLGGIVQTLSSPVTLETTFTETSTKIYKLHFGARTLYSTVTSYSSYLTTLVTYTTSTVPVQNPAIPFGFPFLG